MPLINTVCTYCGKTFKTYPCWVGKRRCPDCKGKDKKVEVKCAWCGKSKKIKPSQFRDSKNKRFYCDPKCKSKWQSANQNGSAHPSYKGGKVQVFCEICGKPKMVFPVRTRQYEYAICNNSKCRGALNKKFFSGDNSGRRKSHPPIEAYCAYCGKVFKIPPNKLQYKKHFCKNSDCKSKWMSKNLIVERNHNWHGGKSFEPYPIEFNENLREAIRQRDGYKCQICGCSELENIEKLAVHHKDYDKNNCHPDNLISLCHRHNSIVNFNRQKWIRYFTKKRENMKDKQLCFRA